MEKSEKDNDIEKDELNISENETASDTSASIDNTENIEHEKKDEKKLKFGKKHSKEKELESKIIELDIKLKEQHDKFLRLYSEFDNYRKRTIKEKFELIKNASEEIVCAILPIVDDFERAITLMENTDDTVALKEGEKLIYTKLLSILEQKGLQEMKCLGEPFNPDLQEAITQIPSTTEEDKGKVTVVTEKGYYLNEKVIRYAKVIVAN